MHLFDDEKQQKIIDSVSGRGMLLSNILNMFDRLLIWMTIFASIAFVCALIMVVFGIEIALPSRMSGMQRMSSLWILIPIPIAFAPAFFFRNLGGVFCILVCGLIPGSTIIALLSSGSSFASGYVPWLQIATSIFVVAAVIPGVMRMDMELSEVDASDLFT